MTERHLTYKIRGAIYSVYNALGPGLLESVYEAALCYELRKQGLQVENQVKLDVMYDGTILPIDFRLDILVENSVIIELKSVEELKPVHHKQLLTYLRIANKHIGFLVNFNTDDINDGIFRKINGYR
jgi:GxxExxY protein